jgi:hypothetical protein
MALPFLFATEDAADGTLLAAVVDAPLLGSESANPLGVLWSDSTPTQPSGWIIIPTMSATTSVVGRKDVVGAISTSLTAEVTVVGSEGALIPIQVTLTATVVVSGGKGAQGQITEALSNPTTPVLGRKGARGQIEVNNSAPTASITGTAQLAGEPHSGSIATSLTPTTSVSGKKAVSASITITQTAPTVSVVGTKFIPVLGQGMISTSLTPTTSVVGKKAVRGTLAPSPGTLSVAISGVAYLTKGIFVWMTSPVASLVGRKDTSGRIQSSLTVTVSVGVAAPPPRVYHPKVREYRPSDYAVQVASNLSALN